MYSVKYTPPKKAFASFYGVNMFSQVLAPCMGISPLTYSTK
jgi:hypothetical protein